MVVGLGFFACLVGCFIPTSLSHHMLPDSLEQKEKAPAPLKGIMKGKRRPHFILFLGKWHALLSAEAQP